MARRRCTALEVPGVRCCNMLYRSCRAMWQRYGPPPSYPSLKIPGLNAPIPPGASFGDREGQAGGRAGLHFPTAPLRAPRMRAARCGSVDHCAAKQVCAVRPNE
jgi:hypothetical protein